MPLIPSIKGSVFAAVAEEFQKLFDSGRLGREQADRWLQPKDYALIDANISISSWYDIGTFTRASELLRDVVGDGSSGYLEQMGRSTARRLLEAGLYSQLEYLHRTRVANETESRARHDAFGRDLRRLSTLSNSIYNFSTWTATPDRENPLRYVIEVTEAASLSDVICWRANGFMNEMAAVHGIPDLWAWKRAAKDGVRFRMLLDL